MKPRASIQSDFGAKLKDPVFLPSRADVLEFFQRDEGYLSLARVIFYCFEHKIFDIWTSDYIKALARYIASRINPSERAVVLEVGAGNGRLTYFLTQWFSKHPKILAPTFVATDNGESKISAVFPVEKMSCKKALKTCNPSIVISSWMPWQEDWTAAFRRTPSVQEYILIGETDGGCCGDPWKTWGDDSWGDAGESSISPYAAEGFERVNLRDLSKLQLCRTDILDGKFPLLHSRTVSFRRVK